MFYNVDIAFDGVCAFVTDGENPVSGINLIETASSSQKNLIFNGISIFR